MRAKCENDIRFFEDEAMFIKSYFMLARNEMTDERAVQEDCHREMKNGIGQDMTTNGYNVPSYEQLAASLVQLDRGSD